MYRDTKYNKITIATLKAGLLLVLILYLTSVNLFHHIHIVEGKVILHSHLYSGQEDKSPVHTHTNAEMKLIQHLMTVEITGSAYPTHSIIKFQNKPVTIFPEIHRSVKVTVLKDNFFLRPPPVL